MPLKLVPPRQGKSPNWTIRGTYLGRYVDRSAGTGKRAVAVRVLQGIERDIEGGRFARKNEPTFASAALAYMRAGGERTHLLRLLDHFKDTPLAEIGQGEIDAAAALLYPTASPATRNRQAYTPVCAVLRHAGVDLTLRRPKGAAGRRLTGWLWPEQALALLAEADTLDREFGLLLRFLLYTGERLSEPLDRMTCNDVRLVEGFAYLSDSKNGDPRPIYLPGYLRAELANHPRGLERGRERLFRFHKGGHLYSLFKTAAFRAGIDLPERQAFHVLCHTWATWMRRYGAIDTKGLVSTGRWKDRKSADRYEHVVTSEEARQSELLPTPRRAAQE